MDEADDNAQQEHRGQRVRQEEKGADYAECVEAREHDRLLLVLCSLRLRFGGVVKSGFGRAFRLVVQPLAKLFRRQPRTEYPMLRNREDGLDA